MNSARAVQDLRLVGDPAGRYWVEMADVNPGLADQFRQVLLAFLAFDRDRRASMCGTGFLIAAANGLGLAMSAKHVWTEGVAGVQRPARHSPSAYFVPESASQPSLQPHKLQCLYMNQAVAEALPALWMGYMQTLDIGCCLVKLPDFALHRQHVVPIDTSVPEVGETVHIVALDQMSSLEEQPPHDATGAGQILSLSRRVRIRRATVMSVHQDGFRQFKWPCFTTTAPVDPGMSGGLVYRLRDNRPVAACGVISADASTEEARSDPMLCGESVIASTWPAMALTLPISTESGAATRTLLEMVQAGAMPMPASGIDALRVEKDEDGNDLIRRVPR